MRISDWSSDVCSSDLHTVRNNHSMSTLEIRDLHVSIETDQGVKQILRGVDLTINQGEIHATMRSDERREGTSVSVRVDIGGRRLVKKQKNILSISTQTSTITSHQPTTPTTHT